DGDERFQRADSKVRSETDAERSDHRVEPAREKEWNDWNEGANGSGNACGNRGSPLIRKPMLGQTEFALRHRLHELLGLLSEALRHLLRLFRRESLQLIEERHLFDFFLGIFFDFRALARNFRFINFRFTFRREILACSRA